MNSLKDWFEDESNMDQLSALLRHPILDRALTLVEKANAPVFRPGVSTTDLALLNAFQAGIHHARTALTAMTQLPTAGDAGQAEWEGDHVIKSPENNITE
jgi:hypothetical protein